MRRPGLRVSVALCFVLVFAELRAADEPKSARGRWHFEYEGPPALSLSVFFSRGPSGDEVRLLVKGPSGRYRLTSRQDPSGSDSFESVEDPATGETFSRRLLLTRYQDLPECGGVGKNHPDACVLFEGKGGRTATALSAFAGSGAADVRRRVIVLTSEPFRARLFGLSELFSVSAEFDAYGEDFLGLVWPDRFANRKKSPALGKRTAGCEFDESFGLPCTEAELAREKKRFPRGS
jgi:hypothetical protein